MQKRFLIAALAASLSLPLALNAADGKKKGGPFAAADKDSDGKITKAEFVAAMTARLGSDSAATSRFAQLDKDGDGSLTRQEFNAGMGEKKGDDKKSDDKDSDGKKGEGKKGGKKKTDGN